LFPSQRNNFSWSEKKFFPVSSKTKHWRAKQGAKKEFVVVDEFLSGIIWQSQKNSVDLPSNKEN
jgi:hypothetical protein